MLVGEVAKATGVSIHTVRYYEKFGLLKAKKRRANNYKEYAASAVAIISFIQRAQELGFRLNELKNMVVLIQSERASCNQLRPFAEEKLIEIDEKIDELQKMKKLMQALTKKCQSRPQQKACALVPEIC